MWKKNVLQKNVNITMSNVIRNMAFALLSSYFLILKFDKKKIKIII